MPMSSPPKNQKKRSRDTGKAKEEHAQGQQQQNPKRLRLSPSIPPVSNPADDLQSRRRRRARLGSGTLFPLCGQKEKGLEGLTQDQKTDGYPISNPPSDDDDDDDDDGPVELPQHERERVEALVREEVQRGISPDDISQLQRECAKALIRAKVLQQQVRVARERERERARGSRGGGGQRNPPQPSQEPPHAPTLESEVAAPQSNGFPGGANTPTAPRSGQSSPLSLDCSRPRRSSPLFLNLPNTPELEQQATSLNDPEPSARSGRAAQPLPPPIPHDTHPAGRGAGSRDSAQPINCFDEEIQRYQAEQEVQRQRQPSPVLPSIPQATHPPQPQDGPSHFSSHGLDLTQLDPRRSAIAGHTLQGDIPVATDYSGFPDAEGPSNQVAYLLPTQEITNERIQTDHWLKPGSWNTHSGVAGSVPPEQTPRSTRNFTSPDPNVRNHFSSQIPTDVPSQSRLLHTFSPYATTERLGKRGRDTSAVTSDHVTPDGDSIAEESTSKRQRRVKKIEEDGGKLGKDNRKVNKTRTQNGSLECWVKNNWVPAAYHNDRRHILHIRADRQGQYVHPLDHGVDPDDRMAFHPDYANIDMKTRESRPDILYQWEPTEKPAPANPGYIIDEADGRYLIDVGGHPIRNWPELPVCISGQTAAEWMEFWRRLNPSISLADIVARCPKQTQKNHSTAVKELTLQAFGNRMRRTRVMLGSKAWEPREGTEQIKLRLLDIMPKRVHAELQKYGTTKSWRDLTTSEVDAIFYINKGQGNAMARAGSKKLSQAVRQQRDEKKQAEVDATLRRLLDEKRADDAIYDASELAKAESTVPETRCENQSNNGHDLEALTQGVSSSHSQRDGGLGGAGDKHIEFTDLLGEEQFQVTATGEDTGKSLDYLFEEEGFTLTEPEDGDTTLVENVADQQRPDDSARPSGEQSENVGKMSEFLNNEVEFPDIDPADYRYHFPQTAEQSNHIAAALESTRAEYRRLSGWEPPLSDPQESYANCFWGIMDCLCENYERFRPDEVVPMILIREAWTDSWDGWMAQDVESTNFSHGNDM
ncbi:MAG: hypothetical protein Q9173_000864 [Seirophora scorigena]